MTTDPRYYVATDEDEPTELDLVYDDLRDAHAELQQAKERIAQLEAAMKHVVNELEEDFDTVDDHGHVGPNKAMRLAIELQEAMYGPGGW